MTQLRDLPERLESIAAGNCTIDPIGTMREAATAITALLDVADAAQAMVKAHDFASCCHPSVYASLRTAIAALNKEAK